MRIKRTLFSIKIKLIIIIFQQIISLLYLSTSKNFIPLFYFIIIQPHLKHGIVSILQLVSASKKKNQELKKNLGFFFQFLYPQDQENKQVSVT